MVPAAQGPSRPISDRLFAEFSVRQAILALNREASVKRRRLHSRITLRDRAPTRLDRRLAITGRVALDLGNPRLVADFAVGGQRRIPRAPRDQRDRTTYRLGDREPGIVLCTDQPRLVSCLTSRASSLRAAPAESERISRSTGAAMGPTPALRSGPRCDRQLRSRLRLLSHRGHDAHA